MTLAEYFKQNPSALNGSIQSKFECEDLPFLFKVLSVRTALSIQAHPDKALAAVLHRRAPDLYPDANHKPEMAIALTPMEALMGFRPLAEIAEDLEQVPELSGLFGADLVQEFVASSLSPETGRHALKKLFTALMTADPSLVKQQLKALVERIDSGDSSYEVGDRLNESELVLRLNESFPGDVGCFSVYFMNYVCLRPGDAVFIAANEPHAYLSGGCLQWLCF